MLKAEDVQRFVGGQARVCSRKGGNELLVLITEIETNGLFTDMFFIYYDPGRVAVRDGENNLWVYCDGLDINQVFLVQEPQPDHLLAEIELQARQVVVWDDEHEARMVLTPPGHLALVNPDEILGVAEADRG